MHFYFHFLRRSDISSFIHSIYRALPSLLLLRDTPDTAPIIGYCVGVSRLSTTGNCVRNATNLPISHDSTHLLKLYTLRQLHNLLLLVLCLLGRFKCLTSPFLSLLSLFFQLSIS